MGRTVVLCILDGVGWGRRDDGNAVHCARTPALDHLMSSCPWGLLKAHGTAVGLPSDGDMGNSEVGHNAMGAGRVFDQGAKLVNQAIESGSIWKSEAWCRAVKGRTLHLLGLLSDGNVHSHIDHLRAMVSQASLDGVERVRVHILTDGRDVGPRTALEYVVPLEQWLAGFGPEYCIATGGGRMHISMDRYEADWPMVERGYRCHVLAEGRRFPSASEAVRTLYSEDPGVNDQWLPSFVVGGYGGAEDGDSLLLFNFRGDRAVQLSRAMEDGDFDFFDRGRAPSLFFAGMMEYDGDLKVPRHHLVTPPSITDTVGERMSAAGLRALSISETQKFGHVTFFFNGNRSEALPFESQVEIPSLKLPFDQAPAMSAEEVTDSVCDAMRGGSFDHIRLNLANGDMVGHTGNFPAAVEAMETIDACLARLAAAAEESNSILLVTADHGNADEMYQWDKKKGRYKTGEDGRRTPSTSHSTNPVPLILLDPASEWSLSGERGSLIGGLAQIGGSLLDLCGLEVPEHYLPSLMERQ
jgi:2,3-bisphosphoglycerate-independent phosphoglycerate mutase